MTNIRVVALLGAAVVAGPATLSAQESGAPRPAPCAYLADAMSVKQCIAREAALVDSIGAIALRRAMAAFPELADSLAVAERAAAEQSRAAVDGVADPTDRLSALLVATRARTFRLRHRIMLSAVRGDSLLPPPVRTTWRNSVGADRGQILTLHNNTARTIEFDVRLYNPLSDELRRVPVRLQGYGRMDIGWIEGWPFASGHLVQVFFGGFQPQLVVAP